MNVTKNADGTNLVQLRMEARPGDDGWTYGGVNLDGEFIQLATVSTIPFQTDAAVQEAFGELLKVLAASAVRTAVGDKAADSVRVERFQKTSG